jgi:hypothetical protein
MCKEMLVILVNKVVDPKRIIGKKWRVEEEERHKGSLTPKKTSDVHGHYPVNHLFAGTRLTRRTKTRSGRTTRR